MSYAFQVRKEDDKLVIDLAGAQLEQVLKQIPDGAIYIISGHTPGPETSSVSHLQVNLLVSLKKDPGAAYGTQKLIASAAASYNTEG